MKPAVNLALIITLLILFTPFSYGDRGVLVLSPDGGKVEGHNWLLVIGINDYQHWPVLKTAVNDAKAVRDVLLDRYCFDAEHTIELYNAEATRENIIEKFRWLARHVKKDDSILVFYAGHGHLDAITKEGSWVPVESGTKNAAAWISNHAIKNYLKVDVIKARHALLISDSCFSGDFFQGGRGMLPEVTPAFIRKAWARTSRQAISSGGLEPVSDLGFGNNSVFSYFFVKALRENREPFLVPSNIFSEVRAGVAANATQFPQFGPLSGAGGQQGGEFVFFLKQDAQLDALQRSQVAKQTEIERLQKMGAEAQKAKAREQAEIVKKKKELAELDAQIAALKRQLNVEPQVGKADSLDAMLSRIELGEEQQHRIEAIDVGNKAEEVRQQAEIERLKKQKQDKVKQALQTDIAKYKKIINSQYGVEMREAAWDSLIKKYPAAAGVSYNDLQALEVKVVYGSYEDYLDMEFVYITPGTFMMGSPAREKGRDNDERQHSVTLTRGYYMQTTEVSIGQYRKFLQATGNEEGVDWQDAECPVQRGGSYSLRGNKFGMDFNQPMVEVSWHGAKAFADWLSQKTGKKYRLPTEAEWEYACRAGSTTPFCFTNAFEQDKYVWYKTNAGGKTHPVAQKRPNAWGLYDMHGNVWEWCQDWYAVSYPPGPVVDPQGPSAGSARVLRGSSWDGCIQECRSASRHRYGPVYSYHYLGFRLVRLPSEDEVRLSRVSP